MIARVSSLIAMAVCAQSVRIMDGHGMDWVNGVVIFHYYI
jgi:hypothetical protein